MLNSKCLKKGTPIPYCSTTARMWSHKKGATAMRLEVTGLAIFAHVSKANRYEDAQSQRVWHLVVKGAILAALIQVSLTLGREKDLVICSCMRLLRR